MPDTRTIFFLYKFDCYIQTVFCNKRGKEDHPISLFSGNRTRLKYSDQKASYSWHCRTFSRAKTNRFNDIRTVGLWRVKQLSADNSSQLFINWKIGFHLEHGNTTVDK